MKDQEAVHEGREVFYSCLSRLFLEPPSFELYKMLNDIKPGIACFCIDGGDNLLVDGATGILSFIDKRNLLDEKSVEKFDLAVLKKYTRLFCLTDSLPNSESYYTSVEKLVMQESTGKVHSIYNSFGFKVSEEVNEPDDHIAHELKFMSYLSRSTRLSDNQELVKVQISFIDEHLLNWFGEFVKKIINYPESLSFYAPLAYFTLGYIKTDRAFLESLHLESNL